MNLKSKQLENEFKVISAIDNSYPLICLQLYFRIGSAWEKRNEAGYSHFTEHLVFKSTKKFPENSIMEYITNLGGYFNAYTEYDSTCFYVCLPSKFLAEGLEYLAELSRFSNYSEEEFQFEKQVVIEELKEYQNNPEDNFLEEIVSHYFQKNPYKYPIIGNLDSLKNATYQELQNFYQKYYIPQNAFLVATGDFQQDELIKLTTRFFGDWQKGKKLEFKRTLKDFPQRSAITSYPKKVKNDILAFILPDLSDCEPEAYPLSFVTKVFATGKNSRLHDRLFIKEKLIDGIKVNSISGVNDGATTIFVYPKNNADLKLITKIFLEELEQFVVHGLDQNEMNEHKTDLLHYYLYSYEYLESLASSLGTEELAIGYEEFQKYPNKIKQLTLQELNSTIKKYFKMRHLHIDHLGNKDFPIENLLQKIEEKRKFAPAIAITKNIYETTLSDGSRVILKKVKNKPITGISIAFNSSQLHEAEKNLGINLVTSTMLMYGNVRRNYQQLRNFCIENGIKLGIDPALETTNFNLKCFNDSLQTSLELLSDVISTPTFPADHFENIVQSFKSNLDRMQDYPEHLAYSNWKKMLFGKNSNFISKSGRKSTLSKLTLKQLKDWHQKYFLQQNLAISIVGDINFDRTIFLLEKYFANFSQKKSELKPLPIIQTTKKSRQIKNLSSNQSNLILGGFGCKLKDFSKNTAFHVLAQIIGGDTNSILFNELREKRGLAYSVSFDFISISELGYWNIQVVVDKKNQRKTIDLIYSILDNIKVNGISERELQTAKNYIRGQRLLSEESVANQAQLLATLASIDLDLEFYREREKRLQRVTKNDLHQLAKKYFVKENFYLYILT